MDKNEINLFFSLKSQKTNGYFRFEFYFLLLWLHNFYRQKMNRFTLAAMATLLLAAIATSCDKTPNEPKPKPLPEPGNVVTMTEATPLYYYGDRKTEGLYNYFVGFSTTAIEEDETGYMIPSGNGYMIKIDLYSSTPSDSWETAVLPDGKFQLQGENEELGAGMMEKYYTRLEKTVDGEVKSTDFNAGQVEISNKDGVTTVKGSFVTADGQAIEFIYEGKIETDDPDESETIPPFDEAVNATMNYGFGVYYGDEYSSGTDNYQVLLTNAPFDNDGNITGEGYTAVLSFYTKSSDIIDLAEGTYTVSDSYEAGTVEQGFIVMDVYGSYVIKYDKNGNPEKLAIVESGSVKVGQTLTGYTINADLVSDSETSIKFSYTGDLLFDDESSNGGGDDDDSTTLTEDISFSFAEDAEIEIGYYGDYYENSTDNWMIFIEDDNNGIAVEINTAKTGFSTKFPFPENGQYNLNSDYGIGMLPGVIDEEGYLTGTFYYVPAGDNGVSGYAMATEGGTIKYSKDGDMDVLKIEVVDSKYHLVSAEWKGVMPEAIDATEEAAPATKSTAEVRLAKKTVKKPAKKATKHFKVARPRVSVKK